LTFQIKKEEETADRPGVAIDVMDDFRLRTQVATTHSKVIPW
jgi:hypothetical protein